MKRAQLHSDGGSPAIYIDGVKTLPMIYGLSDIPGSRTNTAQAQKNIRQFAEHGIHIITCDSELRLCWHKDGGAEVSDGFYGIPTFDPEPIQSEIAYAMDADPDTKVILRLHLNAPYWWMRDNPEELVIYKDKPGADIGDTARLIRGDMIGVMRVSIASRKWMSEAGEILKKLCQAIWDTEEGKAVLAIQVACGVNGEWHQWGCDCGKPMKERFHALLREKYGTDEALQIAWGNPNVTIDTAQFTPDSAQPGDDGIFRDPVKSRNIMDAQECIQISVPEAILHFCKIIKENWGRPVLTGSFYGYYLGTTFKTPPIGGHLFPEMLYNHPEYIDFLSGPFPYKENRLPEKVPMSRALIESNRLRGKLWLTEMDQHPAGTEDFVGGDPNRMEETVGMLRRNTFLPMMKGAGLWFYDHRLVAQFAENGKNPYCASIYRKAGWWDNPLLLQEIEKMKDICEKYILPGYKPAADVLVVYCQKMHFGISRFIDDEYALHDAISRSGAAFDCIYFDELSIAEIERYRCVVFPNAYRLDRAQRKLIREKCAGRQSIFLYAAGFNNDKTLSMENIKDITGISVKRIENAYSYKTDAPFEPEEITCRKSGFTPLFAVEDDDAEPIAHYADGNIAAARKENIWYFALPKVSCKIMRHILAYSGVHLYSQGSDPVFAGCGLVAVNTYEGGKRTLLLKNGKTVSFTMKPYETAVFDAETGIRLL